MLTAFHLLPRNFLGGFFLLLISICHVSVAAEHYQWTWVAGHDHPTTPVITEVGVPSPENTPGLLLAAGTWKDIEGNFWFYGGAGRDLEKGTNSVSGAMWRFNPATLEWTCINEGRSDRSEPVYGIKGVASPENWPGNRIDPATWIDNDGNFWMFAGEYYDDFLGYYPDLWKYELSSGLWTWISGVELTERHNLRHYGELGVTDPANHPGFRFRPATWTDLDGNLWLFGGLSWGETGDWVMLNDLWKFQVTTGLWTWIRGSKGEAVPNYGIKGHADPLNNPPGGEVTTTWVDPSGNLWMFGGSKSVFIKVRHDVWRYSPGYDTWTWVGGSDQVDVPSNYGTLNVPDELNLPGGRLYSRAWYDGDDFVWIYGGYGSHADVEWGRAWLSDLWKYQLSTNLWTWVGGSQEPYAPAVFGQLGLPSATNFPGAKMRYQAVLGNDGAFYLIGGTTIIQTEYPPSGTLADVWRLDITPDSDVKDWALY